MKATKRFSKPKPSAVVDEVAVKALIEKGGSVAERERDSDGHAIKQFNLRLPDSLGKQIDDLRSRRRVKPSRHTWILEAIYEKLDREESKT